MQKFKQFISPHNHSHYSLDGASTVSQMVDRSISLGATHLALTEHGNMNSGVELYHTCKKKGISPILGIELYLQPAFIDEVRNEFERLYKVKGDGHIDDKTARLIERKIRDAYVHLTVHFRDQVAYEYFCKLTPKMEERAIVKYGERKPVATIDELAGASGHITICSSCLIGLCSKYLDWEVDRGAKLKFSRPDLAEKAYHTLRDIAGQDNFFVEVFPHIVDKNWTVTKNKENNTVDACFKDIGYDLQLNPNRFMMDLARKNNDPIIVSTDAHFALPEQKIIQDAKLSNGTEGWRFHESYYMKSSDECFNYFAKHFEIDSLTYEKWIDNSHLFASRFDHFKLQTSQDRWILPELPNDWMGWLKAKIDFYGRMNWQDAVMVQWLQKEISVYSQNGTLNLISYFTIPEKVAQFCRANGILLIPRGSSTGSLLLYLLGVSHINPITHDLSLERFITLGRIKSGSLPDVDMDFSDRDRVFEFLKAEYGDAFVQLSIDSKMKVKTSIKDACRFIHGEVMPEIETYCSKLPTPPQGVDEHDFVFGYEDQDGNHIQGLIEYDPNLKEFVQKHPDIWATAVPMMGIIRQKSTHACGAVIADRPIQELAPVMVINDTKLCGLSPKFAESVGLVKYDFLNVNTLYDIQKTLELIKERRNIDIDMWSLPDDMTVYSRLWEGDTVGVFQFDTETVRPFLVGTKPKSREELANLTALGRPGTLDAPSGDGLRTLAQVYVDRTKGEQIKYTHPDLEPILKGTYGINLFQEQTLRIFRDIGGLSFEEAEVVRRAIGKKEKKTLEKVAHDLKVVCLSKGWREDQIQLLVDQIMASASYSFNKSHAVAYAYISYACAYLKLYYPLEFWAAMLTNASKNEVVGKFWRHINKFTILPDINLSDPNDFIITKDGKLVAPLRLLSGIGEKKYEQLTAFRPYNSLDHYVQLHHGKRNGEERSAINRGDSHALIAGGLLDSLFSSTDGIEEKLFAFNQKYAEIRLEKKVEPIPENYVGITSLGQYLAKKELIPLYSIDLRPIMLPVRGGQKDSDSNMWKLMDGSYCLDGKMYNTLLKDATQGKLRSGMRMSFIGYVLDEKIKPYSGKKKKMTELSIDLGGEFINTVLWPAWGDDVAPAGFKKLPCVLYYEVYYSQKKGEWNFGLKGAVPLIDKTGIYNIL